MKKIFGFLTLFISLTIFNSCEEITQDDSGLSDAEIIQGLKEALKVGTDNSVIIAHALDGYYGDNRIRIPFPDDVQLVATTLNDVGLGSLVDEFVKKLNRAAEDAADEAKPIFLNAITGITIADGNAILFGGDNAATEYLKDKTYEDLKVVFRPDIENSLDVVGANQAWSDVASAYNAIPFVDPVNPDLADYTTEKALDGLFVLVADEELKIRTDPAARINEILQSVFSLLD